MAPLVLLAAAFAVLGARLYAVTIATAGASEPIGQMPEHSLDACANGVHWAAMQRNVTPDGEATTSLSFWFSTDNGATWTRDATGSFATSGNGPFSFFIDADDFAHVVYSASANSDVMYRRGTPNVGRTAWTWSAATTVSSTLGDNSPVVIAHREGTGWVAHVVWVRSASTVRWCPLTITSGGVITAGTITVVGAATSVGACVDFAHNGDGKTIGANPDLWFSWQTSAGLNIRKGVYSAGPTWTFNAVVVLDATFLTTSSVNTVCMWDGSRFVAAACRPSNSAVIACAERDAADTTSTSRTPPSLADGVLNTISITYDRAGNIYLYGVGTTSDNPKWVKFDRAAGTWGAWSAAIEAVPVQLDQLHAKRGPAGGDVAVIYMNGATPIAVRYDRTVILPVGQTHQLLP